MAVHPTTGRERGREGENEQVLEHDTPPSVGSRHEASQFLFRRRVGREVDQALPDPCGPAGDAAAADDGDANDGELPAPVIGATADHVVSAGDEAGEGCHVRVLSCPIVKISYTSFHGMYRKIFITRENCVG